MFNSYNIMRCHFDLFRKCELKKLNNTKKFYDVCNWYNIITMSTCLILASHNVVLFDKKS